MTNKSKINIPGGWLEMKFGDTISSLEGGGTPSKKIPSYWGNEIPWATVKDISNFNPESTQDYITKIGLDNSSSRLIPKGTMVMPTRMLLGVSVFFNIDVAINQDLKAIYFKDDYDKKFMHFWVICNSKRINQLGVGSTVAGISQNQLKSIKSLFPTLSEQKRIVTILEIWDLYLEKLEQKIGIKKNIKRGLMQQLLMGKMRLNGFHGEWGTASIGDIADRKIKWSFTGGPFGSNLKQQDYSDRGVRILQLQNIGDGEFLNDYKLYTTTEKANELLSCNIYPGEILLAKMGDPVARACIVPDIEKRFLMASDGIRLLPDKSRFDINFIYYAINSREFRLKTEIVSSGSTRKRIGLGVLKKLKLKIPEILEQKAIARILTRCDEEIRTLERKEYILQNEKKFLLNELLTGRIRTPEHRKVHK